MVPRVMRSSLRSILTPKQFIFVPVQVQFILNEINSSHILTSDIFVKILSLESLATYHPENRKNSDCLGIRRNFSGLLDFARQIQRHSLFRHSRSREFSRLPLTILEILLFLSFFPGFTTPITKVLSIYPRKESLT